MGAAASASNATTPVVCYQLRRVTRLLLLLLLVLPLPLPLLLLSVDNPGKEDLMRSVSCTKSDRQTFFLSFPRYTKLTTVPPDQTQYIPLVSSVHVRHSKHNLTWTSLQEDQVRTKYTEVLPNQTYPSSRGIMYFYYTLKHLSFIDYNKTNMELHF